MSFRTREHLIDLGLPKDLGILAVVIAPSGRDNVEVNFYGTVDVLNARMGSSKYGWSAIHAISEHLGLVGELFTFDSETVLDEIRKAMAKNDGYINYNALGHATVKYGCLPDNAEEVVSRVEDEFGLELTHNQDGASTIIVIK